MSPRWNEDEKASQGRDLDQLRSRLVDENNVAISQFVCFYRVIDTYAGKVRMAEARKLDKIDRNILKHLQADAGLTNAELAGRVNLSPTAAMRGSTS